MSDIKDDMFKIFELLYEFQLKYGINLAVYTIEPEKLKYYGVGVAEQLKDNKR